MFSKRSNVIRVLTVVAIAPIAGAGSGTFDLSWYTIDGGGGTSSGGTGALQFTLDGTIGQPDAGAMSGGTSGSEFTLVGGFIAGIAGGGTVTAPCPADINDSGEVNAADLAVLLGAWSIPTGSPGCSGNVPCAADLNHDALVNAADLALLLGGWGPC